MISPILPWWTSAGDRAPSRRGEQKLHVAGAHVAAVDAVDGTRLALDPA